MDDNAVSVASEFAGDIVIAAIVDSQDCLQVDNKI